MASCITSADAGTTMSRVYGAIFPPFQDPGGCRQILDPAIGTAPDIALIHPDVLPGQFRQRLNIVHLMGTGQYRLHLIHPEEIGFVKPEVRIRRHHVKGLTARSLT